MSASNEVPEELRARLQAVRLFLCDVDGILTDTAVWMGAEDELKRVNIQDGLGMRLLPSDAIPAESLLAFSRLQDATAFICAVWLLPSSIKAHAPRNKQVTIFQ